MTAETGTKPRPSAGRRIWYGIAIIISLFVLLIALAGIIGTWVAHGTVIDIGLATFETIEEVAGIGRETAATVDGIVNNVRDITDEVDSAVDEIAQNVSDKGLILTLLPPEKEQRIYDAADRIGETLSSIMSVVNAVGDLLDAIDSIPFVDLPKPDPVEVERMESDLLAFRADLEQMGSDIQLFRDEAAGDVRTISEAAGRVTNRLDTTRANLNEVDSALAQVENRARSLQDSFPTIVTIVALLITLFLLWVAYGMVVLMRNHWQLLRPPAQTAKLPAMAATTGEKVVGDTASEPEPASKPEPAPETEPAPEPEPASDSDSSSESETAK